MSDDDSTNRGLNRASALIVDDHPFVCIAIGEILKGLEFQCVDTAETGAQARQRIAASDSAYELILCDLNMPEEDGLVFLRNLAESDCGSAIVLMSAEDPGILKAARSIGETYGLHILGSLEKPVTALALSALLDATPNKPRRGAAAEVSGFGPADLTDALDSDGLDVWFQPQVLSDDQSVHGFEALARLTHPERGMVRPDIFIAVAEESAQIVRVTETVVSKSLAALASLQAFKESLSMSINVSARGLDDLSFPDRLQAQCNHAGIATNTVVIELTESALATNRLKMLDILTRFRLKGFQLSIDDFGTGFSSMEQLKSLPFTELKIDKSFVLNFMEDETSRHIVENSVQLASNLKLKTVAEGVENEDTLRALGQMGCTLAQGFHICRPLPLPDIDRWMRTTANTG